MEGEKTHVRGTVAVLNFVNLEFHFYKRNQKNAVERFPYFFLGIIFY